MHRYDALLYGGNKESIYLSTNHQHVAVKRLYVHQTRATRKHIFRGQLPGGGGGGGGGVTLFFSYIRRLGSFFFFLEAGGGVQNAMLTKNISQI